MLLVPLAPRWSEGLCLMGCLLRLGSWCVCIFNVPNDCELGLSETRPYDIRFAPLFPAVMICLFLAFNVANSSITAF